MILGIASGDRLIEYPAYGIEFEIRDVRFREAVNDFSRLSESFLKYQSKFGFLNGKVDLLPKPTSKKYHYLLQDIADKTIEWIAQNSDGWLMYSRNVLLQQRIITNWNNAVKKNKGNFKPFAQSLYIDLVKDPDANFERIHPGYRLGRNKLLKHLTDLKEIGVNHVFLILNIVSVLLMKY